MPDGQQVARRRKCGERGSQDAGALLVLPSWLSPMIEGLSVLFKTVGHTPTEELVDDLVEVLVKHASQAR